MRTPHRARTPAPCDCLARPRRLTDVAGHPVRVRAVAAGDGEAIARLHERCSSADLRRRYLSHPPPMGQLLSWMLDPGRSCTLVVEVDGAIVGLGHLAPTGDAGVGDLAFLIEPAWQGQRIGTQLLDLIIDLARAGGYAALHADVALDNARMRHMFDRRGWPSRLEHGLLAFDLDLSVEGAA